MKSMFAFGRRIRFQPFGWILQGQKQWIYASVERQSNLASILNLHRRLNDRTGWIEFQLQREQAASIGLEMQRKLLSALVKIGNSVVRIVVGLASFLGRSKQWRARYRPFRAVFPAD